VFVTEMLCTIWHTIISAFLNLHNTISQKAKY